MSSHVCFRVNCHTKVGDMVRISGNIPEFGEWDASRAFPLTTDDHIYPTWYNEH